MLGDVICERAMWSIYAFFVHRCATTKPTCAHIIFAILNLPEGEYVARVLLTPLSADWLCRPFRCPPPPPPPYHPFSIYIDILIYTLIHFHNQVSFALFYMKITAFSFAVWKLHEHFLRIWILSSKSVSAFIEAVITFCFFSK